MLPAPPEALDAMAISLKDGPAIILANKYSKPFAFDAFFYLGRTAHYLPARHVGVFPFARP